MCCFGCFGLVIKLVSLVVSKDIFVRILLALATSLCVGGRDGAIFLSIRDER
jgi:hypothetical protein